MTHSLTHSLTDQHDGHPLVVLDLVAVGDAFGEGGGDVDGQVVRVGHPAVGVRVLHPLCREVGRSPAVYGVPHVLKHKTPSCMHPIHFCTYVYDHIYILH